MDLSRPIEALIPGAQGRLLQALVCAGREELSTRAAAEIAGVSAHHASRVLAHLVTLGLVERRDVPPTVLYSIASGSAVAELLDRLCALRSSVFEYMGRSALDISPMPVKVIVYGSVARGESDEASDIDVLLVAPEGVTDSDAWVESVIEWTARVSRFAGSVVQVLEMDEREWRDPDRSASLRGEIDRDGIVVFERAEVDA